MFLERYGPLIDARCRKVGLQPADAEDIRAVVLAQLVRALRGFQYDPARRFRGYLQRTVDNAIATHWRVLSRRPGWVGNGGGPPEELAHLGAELDEEINDRVEVLQRAVARVRSEVGAEAWRAFELTAIEGLSGIEAAARLGKSPAAVFMAKCRVVARLRADASSPG